MLVFAVNSRVNDDIDVVCTDVDALTLNVDKNVSVTSRVCESVNDENVTTDFTISEKVYCFIPGRRTC